MHFYKFFLSFFYFMVIVSESFEWDDSKDVKLSVEEKNAIVKFKPMVMRSLQEDFMKSDFYLIRWLRKANLNLSKAKQLLFEMIEWRAKNNMSQIHLEDWSDLEEDYDMNFDGHDKLGRPVLTIDLGDWDLRAAVINGNIRRLQRYLTFSMEKSVQQIFQTQQATGKFVTRQVTLVDTDGVNLRQHGCTMCIAFLVNWVLEKERYYPDFTYESVIINAPVAGAVILNACRAVMSPELNAQTKSFNANKKVWMSFLDQRIERSERCKRYGGVKPC